MDPLTRRRLLGLSLTTGAAALAGCGVPVVAGSGGNGSGHLRALFMKQASYSENDIHAMLASFHRQHPDITVEPTFVAYEALHDKIVISAPAGTYDIVHIDCTWPAELASKNMLLEVTSRYPRAWQDDILTGTLGAVSYRGRRYGVPWSPGGKMFFYNVHMLRKAHIDSQLLSTWDGVAEAARRLKAAGIVEYPMVWSWAHAEAAVCDYAQLLGAFGGRFLDDDGKAVFHRGGGRQALEWMKSTLDDGLSAPASTKLLEDDVNRVVLQGGAAIALNWDYMYAQSNEPAQSRVVGQLVVRPSPLGPSGRGPAVNGSMGLAISSMSANANAAWKLVSYLTSKQNQLRFATTSLPVWRSAYRDPELTHGPNAELAAADRQQLDSLIDRPAVVRYNAVSQEIVGALQSTLVDAVPAAESLGQAASQVDEIIGA